MRHPLGTFLLGLALTLALALAACSPGPPLDDSFLLGGIQVGEPDLRKWTKSLRAAGMNTVATTVYARQGRWDSAELTFEAADEAVLREIRRAKRDGLAVVLILRVHLEESIPENEHLWHGMIMPRDEAELAAWFARYTDFVRLWAEVAEAEGVDLLGISSELNALASTRPAVEMPELERYLLDPEKQEEYRAEVLAGMAAGGGEGAGEAAEEELAARVRTLASWAGDMTAGGEEGFLERVNARRARLETHWLRVIAAARELYSGPLTYAANHDQYREVGFWPHLDWMGINAYFPLRKRFLAPDERGELPALLEAGWRRALGEIEAFRLEAGVPEMPVVFTELGYTERSGSTLAPWAGEGFTMVWGEGEPAAAGEPPPVEKRLIVWHEQPLDPAERREAVAALRRIGRAEFPGLLRGILYWKLSTLPQHREVEPFLAVLGGRESSRELLAELARFRRLE